MYRVLFVVLTIVSFTVSGCLDMSRKKPDAKSVNSKDSKKNNAPKTADGNPNSPGTNIPDDTSDGVGGEEGELSASDKMKQMIKDCGVNDLSGVADDYPIFQKKITALPNTFFLGAVTATTTVEITVTKVDYLKVTDTKIEASLAQDTLQQYFGEADAGPVRAVTVPFADVAKLQQIPAWSNVFCTFVGATELINDRGGKHLKLAFDPPMPIQISPRANSVRFDAEIGDNKVFNGIKVKVVESDKPSLIAGSEFSLNVLVTKIPRDTIVEDNEGNLIEIHSDAAYRVVVDAGKMTDALNSKFVMSLGLDPDMVYYMDQKNKAILWNILDTHNTYKGVLKFQHL
jgi:hypothetical protein